MTPTATTFSVRFLGCKVSQADAALIRDALRDAGHVETPPEAAEVHVVNTCALTVEAERKSRREANRGARAKTLAAIAQLLPPEGATGVVRPFRIVN